MLTHLSTSLEAMPIDRAHALGRLPLPRVREYLVGTRLRAPLLVVDDMWQLPTIDLECGTYLLLPTGSAVVDDDAVLKDLVPVTGRPLLRAERPGVCEVRYVSNKRSSSRPVRVARHQYVGLSQYRYLPGQDDWFEEDEPL